MILKILLLIVGANCALVPLEVDKNNFGISDQEFCQVFFENGFVCAFTTNLNNEKHVSMNTSLPNNYCNVQGCLKWKNKLEIMCQEEETGEIVILRDTDYYYVNKTAIFARFDYLNGKTLFVYDGSSITKFEIARENSRIMLLETDQKLAFTEELNDMLVVNATVFIKQTPFIYLLVNNSKKLSWLEDSDTHTLLFPTPKPAQLLHADAINKNNSLLLLTMTIGILEMLIMVILGYFCNWKIWKTRSGQVYFEPLKENPVYKTTTTLLRKENSI